MCALYTRSTSAEERKETQHTISANVIEKATVKSLKSENEIAKPFKHPAVICLTVFMMDCSGFICLFCI